MISRRRKVVLITALLVLLPVALILVERYRGKRALAQWKAAMVKQGEKLNIDELVPPLRRGEANSYDEFIRLGAQASAGSGVTDLAPRAMRYIGPGVAVCAAKEESWAPDEASPRTRGVTNMTWRTLDEAMARNLDALGEARTALQNRFRAPINYRAGLNNLGWGHLPSARALGRGLAVLAVVDLHHGKLDAAVEDQEALLNIVRSLREDRLVISELVAYAIGAIAVGPTWEALQLPGWTDGQLKALQEAWQALEYPDSMTRALEMERALQSPEFARIRENAKEFAYAEDSARAFGLLGSTTGADEGSGVVRNGLEKLGRVVGLRLWQAAWSFEDELHSLRTMEELIVAHRLGASARSLEPAQRALERVQRAADAEGAYNRMRHLISRLSGGWMHGEPRHTFQAATLRELVVAAIALKRFHLRNGRFPSKLEALVPEFLPSRPRDYMDGQPLRYRLNDDGTFLLYSVGKDGQDDSGDPSAQGPNATSFYLVNCRDMVWPRAASREEIVAAAGKTPERGR